MSVPNQIQPETTFFICTYCCVVPKIVCVRAAHALVCLSRCAALTWHTRKGQCLAAASGQALSASLSPLCLSPLQQQKLLHYTTAPPASLPQILTVRLLPTFKEAANNEWHGHNWARPRLRRFLLCFTEYKSPEPFVSLPLCACHVCFVARPWIGRAYDYHGYESRLHVCAFFFLIAERIFIMVLNAVLLSSIR